MAKIFLLNDGVISIDVDRKSIRSTLEELRSGKVVDASEGSCLLRAWKVGDKIHVAHQFGHDRAWAHDVYVFPFPTQKVTIRHIECFELHKYLAEGNGIPPAEKKR